MCRVNWLCFRGGGTVSSAGGREAGGLRCKDAKRQRSEASIVKIFPLLGEWVQCVGCTPHLVLRTTFSHTGEKEEIFASPFTLHSLLKHKAAFTLAEGATHVAHFDNTRRAAFTLAEVLITLGIIGVVTAMTMPTLINKTQNKQLETAFKVAYSTFSQAVINMREQEGPELNKSFNSYENGKYVREDEFYEKFYKYSKLKIVGECNYSGKYMNYNKTGEAYTSFSGVRGSVKEGFKHVLSNGMCADILINAAQINISVDVNGTKGPNQLGHDIFYFYIDNNDLLKPRKMYQLYSEDELEDMSSSFVQGYPCSSQSKQNGNGFGCAYYALIDRNPDDPSKGYWESLP